MINSNHHICVVNEDSFYNDLDLILDNFDEPFADSSSLPTYFISNFASKNLKVIFKDIIGNR